MSNELTIGKLHKIFCTSIIIKNPLETGFSLRNILYTIYIGCIIIVIQLTEYILFKNFSKHYDPMNGNRQDVKFYLNFKILYRITMFYNILLISLTENVL